MPSRHEDYRYSHPSYGMIRVHRFSGGSSEPKFGSEVGGDGGISITIEKADVEQSLGRNWYYGRETVTEVEMTPVQYAEMISNPNTQGVPCTIKFTQDLGHIKYKGIDTVTEHVEGVIDKKVTDLKSRVKDIDKQVSDILTQKGTLKKGDKDAVRGLVRKLVVDLCGNMEFYENSLKESVERAKMEAKMEIESYMTLALTKLGKKAINHPELIQKLLEAPDED